MTLVNFISNKTLRLIALSLTYIDFNSQWKVVYTTKQIKLDSLLQEVNISSTFCENDFFRVKDDPSEDGSLRGWQPQRMTYIDLDLLLQEVNISI